MLASVDFTGVRGRISAERSHRNTNSCDGDIGSVGDNGVVCRQRNFHHLNNYRTRVVEDIDKEIHASVAVTVGSRPSDHYFRSVRWFVCLFVCAEFFSAVFDPISIKVGYMLYVWV